MNPPEIVTSEFDAAGLKAARASIAVLPVKYCHSSTTPLKVTVESKNTDVTIKLDKK